MTNLRRDRREAQPSLDLSALMQGDTSGPLVETLPATWYTDPAIWQRERWPVFGQSWVLVAYEHQVRNLGDYVTENLAGWPLFIRRTDKGLTAFLNLCPHRAGPLVFDGEGCSKNMVCKYHGWAFNADGKLLSARDFGAEAPPDMDLTSVQVASFRGMVWVCLDPNVAPLGEWLGTFPA